MRQHAEISFAKVNENRDLENGIRVQMSQVDVIKIKDATEKKEIWEGRGREEGKECKLLTRGYLRLGQWSRGKPAKNRVPAEEEPRWRQGGEAQLQKLQTCGYLRRVTGCWGRLRGSLQQTSSQFFSWAPSHFSLAKQSRRRVAEKIQMRKCKN